jgi:hypothetical protein
VFNTHYFLLSRPFNSLLEMQGARPKLIPCKNLEMLGPKPKIAPCKDVSL